MVQGFVDKKLFTFLVIIFNINFNGECPRCFVSRYKFMGLVSTWLPEEVVMRFIKFKELFVRTIPETKYLLRFTILFKNTLTYLYQEDKENSLPWLNIQYR